MPVGEEAAQAEGGERAPVEVDVAPQVGLGDARLVEGTQGAPRALGAEREGRRGVRGAYAMPLAVGLNEVEDGGGGASDMRAKQAHRVRNARRGEYRADARQVSAGCQGC